MSLPLNLGSPLVRVPTGFSLETVTDADSTASNIPGPGRVLGTILTSAGRRLENFIDRVAEQGLGLGPNMAALRLVAAFYELHTWHSSTNKGSAQTSICQNEYPGRIEDPAALLNRVCTGVCTQCGRPYVARRLDRVSTKIMKALTQLVGYIR
jgi:hypothetical protein